MSKPAAPVSRAEPAARNWRPLGLVPITNTRPAFNTPISTRAQSDRTNSIRGRV